MKRMSATPDESWNNIRVWRAPLFFTVISRHTIYNIHTCKCKEELVKTPAPPHCRSLLAVRRDGMALEVTAWPHQILLLPPIPRISGGSSYPPNHQLDPLTYLFTGCGRAGFSMAGCGVSSIMTLPTDKLPQPPVTIAMCNIYDNLWARSIAARVSQVPHSRLLVRIGSVYIDTAVVEGYVDEEVVSRWRWTVRKADGAPRMLPSLLIH